MRQLREDVSADNRNAASFGTAIGRNEIDGRLLRALEGLSSAHRTVFLMSAGEDLKHREIAQRLNVPIGTVMTRLFRARLILSKQLKAEVLQAKAVDISAAG